MRITRASLLTLLFVSCPALALAEPASDKKAADNATSTEPAKAQTSPVVPADGRFKIRRGFFAEADLGLFLAMGGYNTNVETINSRGVSNIQPHIGLTLGYDVLHADTWDLSLGLKFGMGFNSGSGRPAADDRVDPNVATTYPADFSVIETGIEVGASFLVTDRLALSVKLDGGGGFLDPDPTKAAVANTPCPYDTAKEPVSASDSTDSAYCYVPGSGTATFAPIFGVGVGVEYFTLLTDFSVGVNLRFEGILKDGLIPAVSATFPIKYTF